MVVFNKFCVMGNFKTIFYFFRQRGTLLFRNALLTGSFVVIKSRTKSIGSLTNRSKDYCENLLRICVWSPFNKYATHLAQSFRIPNSFYKISHTFLRYPCNITNLTFPYSPIVQHNIMHFFNGFRCGCTFGRPSSLREVPPRFNQVSHFLMVGL